VGGQNLLLISRSDLRSACEGPGGERVIRKLAKLTREGFQLLSVASQPDDWSKSRAMRRRSQPIPRGVRQRIAESGGHLDGVYYIPRSMLTQKKKHEEALRDIMARFDTSMDRCFLISGDKKLRASAESLDIKSFKISKKSDLYELLDQLYPDN
jgi:hypothetical protein